MTTIDENKARFSDYLSVAGNILTLPISTFVTEGLAKIAGFEVLRHGTSSYNYFNIQLRGTHHFDLANQNPGFYLTKDSENNFILRRLNSRYYAAMNGGRFVMYLLDKYLTKNINAVAYISIPFSIMCIFHPLIRFVYRKSEIHSQEKPIFKEDPMEPAAWVTEDSLPNDRIGLIGLCRHIQLKDIQESWQQDPANVIYGVAQLILGAGITYYGLGLFF